MMNITQLIDEIYYELDRLNLNRQDVMDTIIIRPISDDEYKFIYKSDEYMNIIEDVIKNHIPIYEDDNELSEIDKLKISQAEQFEIVMSILENIMGGM